MCYNKFAVLNQIKALLTWGLALAFQLGALRFIILVVPATVISFWVAFFSKKERFYRYPVTSILSNAGFKTGIIKVFILKALRFLSIVFFLLLSLRPQLVDVFSNINLDGVDIMLSIDASRSMELIDDPKNPVNRLVVAKEQALNFIEKRNNDEIGIVIFGGDTLALSPPTLDKPFLKERVQSIAINNMIDSDKTALGKGIFAALTRLQDAKAKSKIVILLTDGDPTAPDDIAIDHVIDVAKQMKIKIYAIGVGGQLAYVRDHFGRLFPNQAQTYNPELLRKIAQGSGGQFFQAKSPEDVKKAYAEIDRLEKSSQETSIFKKYQDFFWVLLLPAIIFLIAELILSTFFWKILI